MTGLVLRRWRQLRPVQFLLGLLCLSLTACTPTQAPASPTAWSGIRDGAVYLQKENADQQSVMLVWKPAWIAQHQPETVYFFGPTGRLLDRVAIAPDETSGARQLDFADGMGTYRVIVPGYSFRRYTVAPQSPMKTAFEPAKGHMSLTVSAGDRLFFTAPQSDAHLHFAAYDGSNSAALSFGNKVAKLTDADTRYYQDHDRFVFSSPVIAPAKLEFNRSGKVGFWLDAVPNLFFLSADDIFEPEWLDAEASIEFNGDVEGTLPLIGSYFEFFEPTLEQKKLAQSIHPAFSNFYIPEDALVGRLDRDLPFLDAYRDIGVSKFVSILNDTRRDSITRNEARTQAFLLSYLKHHKRAGHPIPYLAFVDEPNLRYTDYKTFSDYFGKMSHSVRSLSDEVGPVKIAAPESSRLVGGPTSGGRAHQSGFEWTRKLLADHWDAIDLVSFHMWMIRDLEAIDRYGEEINAVSGLIDELAQKIGKPKKPIAITQTNISSGDSLSTYEQDTFFAGLWWASVISQTANTGRLYALNWFKSVDEGVFTKGLMRRGKTGAVELKPVGQVMAAIHPWLFDTVLQSSVDASELEVLLTADGKRRLRLLVVNKSRRTYQLDLPATNAGTVWEAMRTIVDGGRNVSQIDRPIDASGGPSSSATVEIAPLSIALIEGQRAD